MSNIMLFAVWNRPEMFQLVTESLIEAYNYYPFPDLKFVFAVEAPTDPKVLGLVDKFPFEVDTVLIRENHAGLSRNILEAMKIAMNKTDNYMFFQADDIVVHKTFFKFYQTLLEEYEDKFSAHSLATYTEGGNINRVNVGHAYDAAGACISKEFWQNYILPCSSEAFYSNRPNFVNHVDAQYQEYFPRPYKFKVGQGKFNQQAGLINRLVDVAVIKEGYHSTTVDVARVRNIGFYGRNRGGASLEGNTFEERLDYLREVIIDRDSIYALTAARQYSDYVNFDKGIDDWNGSLIIK